MMNKKTITVLAALVSASSVVSAADSEWAVDVSVTPWLASWEQVSTSADRFGTDAIVVNYDIEDSIAYGFELSLSYAGYSLSLESVQQSESDSGSDDKLSQTKFAFLASEIVEGVSVDFQMMQGSFEGFINGADNNGNTGTGTFETDLNLQDVSVLFYKGLGIGVRSVDYDVPQDLYLVNNSAPNTSLLSGFEEISYSGVFVQLVAMSEDRYNTGYKAKSGLSYVFRYGVGELDPSGAFLEATEATLVSSSSIAANENIMQADSSSFVEADLSYYMHQKWFDSDVKMRFGYRYTQWEASFTSNSDYALVTDFETSFSGPYVAVVGAF